MKLTRKKAIEICKELWTFLAETGLGKGDWDGWKKYGEMASGCPFCEYCENHLKEAVYFCEPCPYSQHFGDCTTTEDDTPYDKWFWARTKQGMKKYAKEFLAQLEQLK